MTAHRVSVAHGAGAGVVPRCDRMGYPPNQEASMPVADRPHVVIVMTDQQRQGFTAGEGFGLDTMPFCDELAASGHRFLRGYTPQPACVPARTSLVSGRFPSAHRVRQNSTPQEVVRGDDLLDVLGAAGYQTMFAGKRHMYRGPDDFDSWRGGYMHTSAPGDDPDDVAFARWLESIDHGPSTEPTPFPLERQYPYRIVSDAIGQLLARDADRPAFLWVSFPEPHNPYQVPEPYWSLFSPDDVPDRWCGPEAARAKGGDFAWMRSLIEQKRPGYDDLWRRYRASYCGMLRLIDDQVRRLYEEIRRSLGENTVVLYLADHGDYVGDYGLQRKGAGVPEALVRIPFFVTGAGVRPVVDSTSFVSLVDILPTVAELAGAEIPLGAQGRSVVPLLDGSDEPEAAAVFDSIYAEGGFGGLPYGPDDRPDLHFSYDGTGYDELNTVTQSGTLRTVRWDRWKLTASIDGTFTLFDVDADPAELEDRWADPQLGRVRQTLLERLTWWSMRAADDLPRGNYTPRLPEHNWYVPPPAG